MCTSSTHCFNSLSDLCSVLLEGTAPTRYRFAEADADCPECYALILNQFVTINNTNTAFLFNIGNKNTGFCLTLENTNTGFCLTLEITDHDICETSRKAVINHQT